MNRDQSPAASSGCQALLVHGAGELAGDDPHKSRLARATFILALSRYPILTPLHPRTVVEVSWIAVDHLVMRTSLFISVNRLGNHSRLQCLLASWPPLQRKATSLSIKTGIFWSILRLRLLTAGSRVLVFTSSCLGASSWDESPATATHPRDRRWRSLDARIKPCCHVSHHLRVFRLVEDLMPQAGVQL